MEKQYFWIYVHVVVYAYHLHTRKYEYIMKACAEKLLRYKYFLGINVNEKDDKLGSVSFGGSSQQYNYYTHNSHLNMSFTINRGRLLFMLFVSFMSCPSWLLENIIIIIPK